MTCSLPVYFKVHCRGVLKTCKKKNQAFSNRKWSLPKLCCIYIYIYTYLIFKAKKRCHTKCLASCISMQPLDAFPA